MMSYEYREVKCPWCDHIFMWNKNGGEGLVINEYRLKSSGEYVRKSQVSTMRDGYDCLKSRVGGNRCRR